MPRYRTERGLAAGVASYEDAEGIGTRLFYLRKAYSGSHHSWVLFRVYRRHLSQNEKIAGFSPFTNYSVADMFTRSESVAMRRARSLIAEKFGVGMRIVVKKEGM